MIKRKYDDYILQIEEQQWDSMKLGVKCGLLTIEKLSLEKSHFHDIEKNIKSLIVVARKAGFTFLTAKINTINIAIVNACLKNNGLLIDTELTFYKNRIKNNSEINNTLPGNIEIKKYKKYWHDSLLKLADTLQYSRFFIDYNINLERAKAMWHESIFNSCNGRADYSIYCFVDNKPVGLMNVFENNNISNIFLIAIHPNFQGRGIGTEMIYYYENSLTRIISQQKVETQIINYGAQKLYIKCGYSHNYSKYIIHIWL